MQLQSRAEVSLTDLCNCCCQWAHNQSHSWPLSGNGTSPLCWCSALLPGNLRLPANIRWYLGVFESRDSLIVLSRDNMVLHFFCCRYLTIKTITVQRWGWALFTFTAASVWFEFVAFETGTSVIAHTAMSTFPYKGKTNVLTICSFICMFISVMMRKAISPYLCTHHLIIDLLHFPWFHPCLVLCKRRKSSL